MNKRLLLTAAFVLITHCLHFSSVAATLSWTGAVGSDFYNPTNWSPRAVPASGDTLNIYMGEVNISPAFTTTGQINWTGVATIRGVLTISDIGQLSVTGKDGRFLTATITNFGTITLTDPVVQFNSSNARIVNQPGALLDMVGDTTLARDGAAGQQILNAGILRKSAGTGTSLVNVPVVNSGDIQAESGTLNLAGGGALSGTCTAASGAAVNFGGGTFALSPSTTLTGLGFVGVATGSSSFSGTLETAMQWTGGTIRGMLEIGSTGTLSAGGNTYTKFLTGTITNFGTIALTGDMQFDSTNALVVNQTGALFDLRGDARISSGVSDGPQIINAGTFRKSAGTSNFLVNVPVANSGTIQVQAGTISLNAPFANTGGGFAVRLNNAAEWGRLVFSGSLKLDGPFSVVVLPGFTPALGSSFQVLSFPSAAGNVTAFQGLDLGGGLKLVPELTRSALNLKVDAYPVGGPPVLSIYRVPKALLVWWPEAYTNYQAEVATNLTAPAWQPVPVTSPNQVLRSPDLPQEYFRLVKQ